MPVSDSRKRGDSPPNRTRRNHRRRNSIPVTTTRPNTRADRLARPGNRLELFSDPHARIRKRGLHPGSTDQITYLVLSRARGVRGRGRGPDQPGILGGNRHSLHPGWLGANRHESPVRATGRSDQHISPAGSLLRRRGTGQSDCLGNLPGRPHPFATGHVDLHEARRVCRGAYAKYGDRT